RLCPRTLGAAVRTRNVGKLHRVGAAGNLLALCIFLAQRVVAVPAVTRLALHQRVDEGIEVTTCTPHLGSQDDGGVDTDDVVAHLDHRPPPLPADVLLELYAQRAVVPRGSGSAIDLGRREDDASPLGKADEVLDPGGSVFGGIGGHVVQAPSGWVSASEDHSVVGSAGDQHPRKNSSDSPQRRPRCPLPPPSAISRPTSPFPAPFRAPAIATTRCPRSGDAQSCWRSTRATRHRSAP